MYVHSHWSVDRDWIPSDIVRFAGAQYAAGNSVVGFVVVVTVVLVLIVGAVLTASLPVQAGGRQHQGSNAGC